MKRKAFRLNGEIGHSGDWVKNGDIVQYIDLEENPPKPYELYYDVVFEDEHLAIIHKPAGIVVSGNQYRTITNTLSYNLRKSTHPDALKWPRPVHRLDAPTSGLLVIAKTYAALQDLSQQFADRRIEKHYEAIVIGAIEKEGKIETEIDAKEALTYFTMLGRVKSLKNGYLTHVLLKPKTGRKHQLRIHMASLDTPILGDPEYGKEGLILRKKGLFLCATKMVLSHPIDKTKITCEIPTPNKFIQRLNQEQRRWERYN